MRVPRGVGIYRAALLQGLMIRTAALLGGSDRQRVSENDFEYCQDPEERVPLGVEEGQLGTDARPLQPPVSPP
jgi:hypothetical protein